MRSLRLRLISMLSLHLGQLSLVYVNTLMIQQVLAEPAWQNRLNVDDRRGLTPLIHGPELPASSRQPRLGPKSVGTQMLLSLRGADGP